VRSAASVRDAQREDAEAIAHVNVASWRWAYRGHVPDEVLDTMSEEASAEGWRGVLARDDVDVVVAEREDRVVGYASAGPVRDEPATMPGGPRDGNTERGGVERTAPLATRELYTLYVLGSEAGTGTGEALLTAAEEGMRGRGADRASLWVLETNARARRFYERRGWTWDGSTSTHQLQCANMPVVRYVRTL
jgi:GNAT superfamily N-acetyltransferase